MLATGFFGCGVSLIDMGRLLETFVCEFGAKGRVGSQRTISKA